MGKSKRSGVPVFAAAVVIAVIVLGAFVLIIDRVEDEERQRDLLWLMIFVVVVGISIFTAISVRMRASRSGYRTGHFTEGAVGRIAVDAIRTGNVWAESSTYRRSYRVKLSRKELRGWAETARVTGLELDRSRSPRLIGTLRGVKVRVDPVDGGDDRETRARASLPVSLPIQCTATINAAGQVQVVGAPPELETALRHSGVPDWLLAQDGAVLEIEAQGARAYAPGIVSDPDLLRGLIELAVSAAETVTSWHQRQ
jgi:hypothetical protein